MFKSELDIFYKVELIDSEPKNLDKIFIYNNRVVIVDEKFSILTYSLVREYDLKYKYLFSYGDNNVYLGVGDIDYTKYNSCTLRDFLGKEDMENGAIALDAFHLMNWYSKNKFCGKCGHKFTDHKLERALFCERCENTIWPTISPAVIVAITNNEEILLTKYAVGEYSNYGLVAGYVEIGENLEQCLVREVFEEVGLKVKNLKYFDSQPWGISGSLLAGFIAEVDGSNTVVLDEKELKEAVWFKRADIPENKNTSSLTWTMIEHFRNNI